MRPVGSSVWDKVSMSVGREEGLAVTRSDNVWIKHAENYGIWQIWLWKHSGGKCSLFNFVINFAGTMKHLVRISIRFIL